jgi:hypothetical protein
MYDQRYPGIGGRTDKIADLIWGKALPLDPDYFLEPFPHISAKGFPEFLKVFAQNQDPLAEKKGP